MAHVIAGHEETPGTVVPDAAPDVEAARPTETTRHLCVATQVDERFCRYVIDTVVDDPFAAIAPSYGVDLGAVARHALVARRRQLVRDLGLVALLVVMVGTVIAGVASQETRSALDASQDHASETTAAILRAVLPATALLIPAWLLVAGELLITRLRVLPRLAEHRFAPQAARPRVSARIRARLEAMADWSEANVVVFSGFNPFVGSGKLVETWSFAIDVRKGRRDPETGARREPVLFGTDRLHRHMREALDGLGLPDARVGERLFVNGADVVSVSDVLRDKRSPPEPHVEEHVLREVRNSVSSRARTYLCFEATGWRGHLVVTMFFRAVRLRDSVFLEGASFVLLPLQDEYYRFGNVRSRATIRDAFGAAGDALKATVPRLVMSPFSVLEAARRPLDARRRRRELDESIAQERVVDYGAATSVRERAMGADPHRYFLMLDQAMYAKVARERLLDSVSEFLYDHGVDTEDFGRQQTVINNNSTLNNGVMVGGSIGAGAAVSGGRASSAAATSTPVSNKG